MPLLPLWHLFRAEPQLQASAGETAEEPPNLEKSRTRGAAGEVSAVTQELLPSMVPMLHAHRSGAFGQQLDESSVPRSLSARFLHGPQLD